MRISHIPNEKRNPDAKNFWGVLADKLGFRKSMTKTASATSKAPLLSGGIQTYGKQELQPGVNMPRAGRAIDRVVDVVKDDGRRGTVIEALRQRTAVDIFSGDQVGTTEEFARVNGAVAHAKAALEQTAISVGKDMQGHTEKLAAVEAAVGGLANKEIRAVPSYKTTLDQIGSSLNQYEQMLRQVAPAPAPMGTMGAFDSVAPQEQVASAAQADEESLGIQLAQAYNSLSFAYSLSAYLSAQAEASGVGAAVPQGLAEYAGKKGMVRKAGSELKGTFDRLAVAPPGREEQVKALKDEPGVDNPYAVSWAQHNKEKKEASVKTAGSGDPGDMDANTNLIYTDINRCRDCVWFESDWTHDTYRDKCKNCIHACLGGTVDHWWPRFYQMTMWMPAWNEPQAEKKKAFRGSLSALDSHRVGQGLDFEAIAQEIAAKVEKPNAMRLVGAFIEAFKHPLLADRFAKIGGQVAAKIAEITGIEFVIHRATAEAWGKKNLDKLAVGEVIAACPQTLQDEMKDEKERAEKKASSKSVSEANKAKLDAETENIEAHTEELRGEAASKCSNPGCKCGSDCDPSKDCPTAGTREASITQEAKGEREKKKRIREQIQKTDNPRQLKELHDALNSIEDREDRDQERKEKRKEKREKKREEQNQAQEPAAVTAAIRGTLCLAKTQPHKDQASDIPGAGDNVAKEHGKKNVIERQNSIRGTLSLAGAKEREHKKPKDYGNVSVTKPEKALSKKSSFEGSLALRGSL